MRTFARLIAVLAALSALSACVVYEPYPGYYAAPSGPGVFDRSWNAALGAFADQGVPVSVQDRANGRV